MCKNAIFPHTHFPLNHCDMHNTYCAVNACFISKYWSPDFHHSLLVPALHGKHIFGLRNLDLGLALIFYLYPQVPVRGGARCPKTTRESEEWGREHAAPAFTGLKALNSREALGMSAPCSCNARKLNVQRKVTLRRGKAEKDTNSLQEDCEGLQFMWYFSSRELAADVRM